MDNPELTQKIISLIPALVVVYNIQKGKYLYVNQAAKTILGYSPRIFLKKGLPFATSLVHPDDLLEITKRNQTILNQAQKAKNGNNDGVPINFEYRMRHKKGHWIWLHSDGIIFNRDSNGKVEQVMNISIDITERKQKEELEAYRRNQIEVEKNNYNMQQMRLVKIRAEIADVLRNDDSLAKILENCMAVVVRNIPATYARIWLTDDDRKHLNLVASSGYYPQLNRMKTKITIGEYAVGKVAKKNRAFITNDLLNNKNYVPQNKDWMVKKNITSFAGYPLQFRNKTVGVITVFASQSLAENTLISLANIADILAQEIERKKVETQLYQSQQRYLTFIKQSSEGIWRFEIEQPVSTKLSVDKQIDYFYQYAYLAECNDALAKMYGHKKASDIIGAKLDDMLIREDPNNIQYLRNFINSSYNLSDAESSEVDKKGSIKYFQNNLVGIIKNGQLIQVWGTQRDITRRKHAEEQMERMAKQKDEFIAIASHELKTPVTSLKAYTQVLEGRFNKIGDESSAALLHKMDNQFNRLISLISDLLDISKIEAGKLQFEIKPFKFNSLIDEIVEQMQRTTSIHQIKTRLDEFPIINGDKNRIGQVIINFISNAIKYSPEGKDIIVKTKLAKKKITLSVQDFGMGISADDQPKVFERFYRSSSHEKESYPGLGLGLYICREIIDRHQGTVGVRSTPRKGSTFFFTLPLTK